MTVSGLRIALVHPYSWPEVRRGAERYLDDLAWYLTKAGHRVDVITGTTGRGSVTAGESLVVRRVRVPSWRLLERVGATPTETFGVIALPRLLRRYDIVHALTPTAALAALASRRHTVFTLLGHPLADHYARNPLERRLTAAAIRAASRATALSSASAAAAEAIFGRRPDVIPPGVRLDRFPAALEPRVGRPVVLFSAALSDRRKGLDQVFRAMAQLLLRHPDARLRLSGPGDHRWALVPLGHSAERVVAAVDVMGPGRLEDVPTRYREATVTVLPAKAEAFGLALVESLASGTPIVCSDSGGMSEIADDDLVGRVVPWGDLDALVDGMDAAIALSRRAGTAARCAGHARRWGWEESIGRAHEHLYRSIAAR